jgi:hypothetical protein
MNSRIRDCEREMTAQRRRRPGTGRAIFIPFNGLDDFTADPSDPPAEIALEATGQHGETAIWLDDFFWLSLLKPWSQFPVTIRFHATPDSLLHPVILHQLNMLRRVAPAWRIVGECTADYLADPDRLHTAALSAYHELHVVDDPQGASPTSVTSSELDNMLAQMRQIQGANQRTTPIVACPRKPHVESAPRPLRMPTVQPARRAV